MGLIYSFIWEYCEKCIWDLPRLTILQKKIILYTKLYHLLISNYPIIMLSRYVLYTPLDPKYKFSLNSDDSEYVIQPIIPTYGQHVEKKENLF